MRAELETGARATARPTTSSSRGGSAPGSPPPDDDQTVWARQEQQVCLFQHTTCFWHLLTMAAQMMIRQQDETITTIAGTLNTLQEQAGLMGQEIGEHNEYVLAWSLCIRA